MEKRRSIAWFPAPIAMRGCSPAPRGSMGAAAHPSAFGFVSDIGALSIDSLSQSRHARLRGINQHRPLRRLIRGDTEADAGVAQRGVVRGLAALVRLHPLHLRAGMRRAADVQWAAGGGERVGGADEEIAAALGARVGS